MKTYLIRCGATRITGIYPSSASAWDDAFDRFGHLAGISVKVLP